MKELQKLIKNNQQPIPLFSKLKEMKAQPIHGIPIVNSDDENDDLHFDMKLILSELNKYKQDRAK